MHVERGSFPVGIGILETFQLNKKHFEGTHFIEPSIVLDM